MEPEVMTVKQVARYLQLDEQTIYKMARQGEIPCTKISSQWRFKKDMVDEWLKARTQHHMELANAALSATNFPCVSSSEPSSDLGKDSAKRRRKKEQVR